MNTVKPHVTYTEQAMTTLEITKPIVRSPECDNVHRLYKGECGMRVPPNTPCDSPIRSDKIKPVKNSRCSIC